MFKYLYPKDTKTFNLDQLQACNGPIVFSEPDTDITEDTQTMNKESEQPLNTR